MPDEPIDRVKSGTDNHTDRVLAFVSDWSADDDNAKLTLSDQSVWTMSGKTTIAKSKAMLDLSKQNKKPLLFAVNAKTMQIGMFFSTTTGEPRFNGESKDGKSHHVNIPPSPRVYLLKKERTWYNAVKTEIDAATMNADPKNPRKFRIAFDSATNEVVDVREDK